MMDGSSMTYNGKDTMLIVNTDLGFMLSQHNWW